MDWIYEPWPWYVSGAAIVLVMLLLLLNGKNFGMSGNLRTFCTLCGAGRSAEFFRFDWKSQRWNLMVVLGTVIGGFIGSHFLSRDAAVDLNPITEQRLEAMGFASAGEAYMPDELFANSAFSEPRTLLFLLVGGLLVGFGARYAGGCTSGHAISGLSDLQWPSLVAVVGFFAGGMIMIYGLFPFIF